MKLIIDIPEDVYTRLFDNGIQDNEIAVDDICEMARALRLGTPLDKVIEDIKTEIEKAMEDFNYDEHDLGVRAGFRFALDIIDNHIRGKEQG